MRTLVLTTAALAAASGALAQAPAPTAKAAGLPAGWQMRLDRPTQRAEDVKFAAMGDGFHATLGRAAAIFYNPAHTARGEYRVRATFTQTRAPEHPEAYGLFIGGKNLDADNQDYLYFVVRRDGKFLIKHRAGAETHTIVDWTEHPAVNKADPQGKATNALAIEVGSNTLRFLVNGTEVHTLEKPAFFDPAGIAGLRINHFLDVHVAGFAVEPARARRPRP